MVEIQLTKQRLVFTDTEMADLLKANPELWAVGLRRGKGVIRQEKEFERSAKKQAEFIARKGG